MRRLKNLFGVGLFLFFCLMLTACSAAKSAASSENIPVASTVKVSSIEENKPSKEKELKMKVKVGDQVFTAKLYDNETSQALLERLPMTVNMTELNEKEKYYNLPENLPAKGTEAPEIIHEGEIMRWSTNCLVLFYTTYSNSYSGYVKIGYIEDIDGLKEAVGKGDVQVTFMEGK